MTFMPSMIQRIAHAGYPRVGSNPRGSRPRDDFGPRGCAARGPSITVIRAMLFAADIMSTLTYGALAGVGFVVPCRPKSRLAQRPNHTASVI